MSSQETLKSGTRLELTIKDLDSGETMTILSPYVVCAYLRDNQEESEKIPLGVHIRGLATPKEQAAVILAIQEGLIPRMFHFLKESSKDLPEGYVEGVLSTLFSSLEAEE